MTDSTRPDIIYATNRLTQHMAKPQNHHAQALKTILRYFKGTRTYGLQFQEAPTGAKELLKTYSDADYSNASNRKSITGNVPLFGDTPILWLSKRQDALALSTTEAEYISETHATQHTKWIRKLLWSTTIAQNQATPHFINNQSAVLIAENHAPTKRRKYIYICHHFLQHHIAENTIQLHRIPSKAVLADILTKPFHRDWFTELRERLNVKPLLTEKCIAATGDCQTPH